MEHIWCAAATAHRGSAIPPGSEPVMVKPGVTGRAQVRAVAGGMVAAAVGLTDLFLPGRAEHQGPDGGGTAAIIADVG